ncbi:hypothetical protein [Streptomyces sp. NPDC015125]|uniref:hypothetical protein n=1 Tax=Streptomyces sp. NPDC015125 TaxID=3364938 RepID=UPI0036F5B6A7
MRIRRILTGAFAAATLAVVGLGATHASAATGTEAATPATPAASHAQLRHKPMDGPPGTVWTGKKFWTLSGCQSAGTDLVASGKWADPFCDGSGLQYDLWARPL